MAIQLSPLDRFITECDKALRTVWGPSVSSERAIPGEELLQPELTQQQKQHSMRLMRINHAGEVSAQALYQGQALTAKLPEVRDAMEQAAGEESEHLAWCEKRITDLGGNTSLLNPVWYMGSLTLGAVAGKIGDKWSLGFVAETETQVVKHLESHLEQISTDDVKSRAILEQMRQDEQHHKEMALDAGGAILPTPIKTVMSAVSKIMIAGSYRI